MDRVCARAVLAELQQHKVQLFAAHAHAEKVMVALGLGKNFPTWDKRKDPEAWKAVNKKKKK
jgi:hypothetical protein